MIHPTDADTIVPVIFGRPNGQTAAVWVKGLSAGHMERYQNTNYWTYDHGGTSLVGTHMELRRQIRRHYQTCAAAAVATA